MEVIGPRLQFGSPRPMPRTTMQVSFVRLDKELPPPTKAHKGDAAVDLRCTVDFTLAPGERQAVPTGIAVAIPDGFAGWVLPRSGHAMRNGLSVVNGPGLIDSGYRGEIKVILVNLGSESVSFERGDRIGQLSVNASAGFGMGGG